MGGGIRRPKPYTYRVRGIPHKWDKSDLERFLADPCGFSTAGLEVHSLAQDIGGKCQVATIDCHEDEKLPRNLSGKPRAPFNVDDSVVNLVCDDHFLGLTTLFSPPEQEHVVDIVAVCGLAGHAFKSFRSPHDDFMWLRDGLPQDLTMQGSENLGARILTYGYSSPVASSKTTQHMGDLASILRGSLSLLAAKRPLILIGHSLGGLIIQQAIVSLFRSSRVFHQKILKSILGLLFFGVPHNGMDIATLIPMTISSRGLHLAALDPAAAVDFNHTNSQVLDIQAGDFRSAFVAREQAEIFCFFETINSSTAKRVFGKWTLAGPERILVTKSSANHCRPWEQDNEHMCAISATHSNLIKFQRHDPAYTVVCQKLRHLCYRADQLRQRTQGSGVKFLVPFLSNEDFVGRQPIMAEMKTRFQLEKLPSERTCRRLSLYGLGGIGKTEIALSFAHWVQAQHKETSVFWVNASNTDRFRQAYAVIASSLEIPGHEDPEADSLSLVCNFLTQHYRRQWVMIVDNVDDNELFSPSSDIDDMGFPATNGLGEYLPDCTHGSILFTTRNKNLGSSLMHGAQPLGVGELLDHEALMWIRRTLGHESTTPEQALALATHLGHHPLALAQALAYIVKNTITVSEYLQDIDDKFVQQLLQHFESAGRDANTPSAAATTWATSFSLIQKIDPLAADFLSLICLFDRQDIPQEFLAQYQVLRLGAIANDDLDASSRMRSLSTLTSYSLIAATADNSYTISHLVQAIARRWLWWDGSMDESVSWAVSIVTQECPIVAFDTLDKMQRLLPHLRTVLNHPTERTVTPPAERAELLYQMGRYFYLTSQWSDAELHARQSRQMYKDSFGATYPKTLSAVRLLLEILIAQGRLSEATELGESEQKRSTGSLGEGHTVTTDISRTLAALYWRQNRLSEAETLLLSVVENKGKTEPERLHETFDSMSELVLVFEKQGRTEQARKLQLDVSTSLDKLVKIYREERRLNEAYQVALVVLRIRENLLGLDHEDTILSVEDLAVINKANGNYDHAQEQGRRVWRWKQRTLGKQHSDTLTSMYEYAGYLTSSGQAEEAVEIMLECLRCRRQVLGEAHPDTVINLHSCAGYLDSLGRSNEALQILGADTSHMAMGQSLRELDQQRELNQAFETMRPLIPTAVTGRAQATTVYSGIKYNPDSPKARSLWSTRPSSPQDDRCSAPVPVSSTKDDDGHRDPEQAIQQAKTLSLVQAFLVEDAQFKELSERLLTTVGRGQFIDTLRRLLNSFHVSLKGVSKTGSENYVAMLFSSRPGRRKISEVVAQFLQPDYEDAGLERRGLHVVPGDAQGLEDWLATVQRPGTSVVRNTSNTYPQAHLDNVGDDHLEKKAGDFQLTSHLKIFIQQSQAFQILRRDLQLMLLPMRIRRVVLCIPRERIWVSRAQNITLSNRAKSWVEEGTQQKWNWWPLQPRMRTLAGDESRLFWKCQCGVLKWKEISAEQHQDVLSVLDTLRTEPSAHYKCASGDRSVLWDRVKDLLFASLFRAAPASNVDPEMQLQPSSSNDNEETRSESHGSDSSPHGNDDEEPAETEGWVLLGVERGLGTMRPAQFEVKSDTKEEDFFQSLKKIYELERGHLRLWLSIWRLHYCEGVKFHRRTREHMVLGRTELPISRDYSYIPNDEEARKEAVNPPELLAPSMFRALYHGECDPDNWIIPQDCLSLRTEKGLLVHIPKRARSFADDKTREIWGLYTMLEIGYGHVFAYHILICLGPLVFWICWLHFHPNDLQTASVPLTLAIGGVSLFWSSSGILARQSKRTS